MACAAATYLGFWEEGLEISWTPYKGGVPSMKASLAGEVDVSYAGLGLVINLRATENPCWIVVSMARSLAQNLVAKTG
jgi:ABC-type nitrate/sulfonate/bicarbonate transport system substrate-binding protein